MRTVQDLSLDELRTIVSVVQDTLNGLVWSADTLDTIAAAMRDMDLTIAEPAKPGYEREDEPTL